MLLDGPVADRLVVVLDYDQQDAVAQFVKETIRSASGKLYHPDLPP